MNRKKFYSLTTTHYFLLFRPHRSIAHRRGCGICSYAAGKVLVSQVAESTECTEVRTIKSTRSNRALKDYAGKAFAIGKAPPPQQPETAPAAEGYTAIRDGALKDALMRLEQSIAAKEGDG